MNKEIYDYVTQNEVNKNILKTLGSEEESGDSVFAIATIRLMNSSAALGNSYEVILPNYNSSQKSISPKDCIVNDGGTDSVKIPYPIGGQTTINLDWKRVNLDAAPTVTGNVSFSGDFLQLIISGDGLIEAEGSDK